MNRLDREIGNIKDSIGYIKADKQLKELMIMSLDSIERYVQDNISRHEEKIHDSCKLCRACDCENGKIEVCGQMGREPTIMNCPSCVKGLRMEVKRLKEV